MGSDDPAAPAPLGQGLEGQVMFSGAAADRPGGVPPPCGWPEHQGCRRPNDCVRHEGGQEEVRCLASAATEMGSSSTTRARSSSTSHAGQSSSPLANQCVGGNGPREYVCARWRIFLPPLSLPFPSCLRVCSLRSCLRVARSSSFAVVFVLAPSLLGVLPLCVSSGCSSPPLSSECEVRHVRGAWQG